MSDSQRRRVRVRRSPKIGVFLMIGALAGVLVAVIAVGVTPPDETVPTSQAIGFLALLLAPIGALVSGVIALLIDARSERRARTVDVDVEAPPARQEAPTAEPRAEAVAEHAAAETPAEPAPERAAPVDDER